MYTILVYHFFSNALAVEHICKQKLYLQIRYYIVSFIPRSSTMLKSLLHIRHVSFFFTEILDRSYDFMRRSYKGVYFLRSIFLRTLYSFYKMGVRQQLCHVNGTSRNNVSINVYTVDISWVEYAPDTLELRPSFCFMDNYFAVQRS